MVKEPKYIKKLSESQKRFIEDKVRSCATKEEAIDFYQLSSRDGYGNRRIRVGKRDSVSMYGQRVAKLVYGK